mmetsp:Transcript_9389/g.14317  ORF Transcript_9389/g.14317 Transcript_9389/m.14317 type:complete len:252 (-) Transcript_9389:1452-2207(-)
MLGHVLGLVFVAESSLLLVLPLADHLLHLLLADGEPFFLVHKLEGHWNSYIVLALACFRHQVLLMNQFLLELPGQPVLLGLEALVAHGGSVAHFLEGQLSRLVLFVQLEDQLLALSQAASLREEPKEDVPLDHLLLVILEHSVEEALESLLVTVDVLSDVLLELLLEELVLDEAGNELAGLDLVDVLLTSLFAGVEHLLQFVQDVLADVHCHFFVQDLLGVLLEGVQRFQHLILLLLLLHFSFMLEALVHL